MKKVCVVGAGAWGSVFANILAENLDRVPVWEFENEVIDSLNTSHTHKRHPGKTFSKRIAASNNLQEVVTGAEIIFFALSAQHFRGVLKKLKPFTNSNQIFASLSKGIEVKTNKTMTQIIAEELEPFKENIAAISGPNLATELIEKKPSGAVVASNSKETIKLISQIITAPYYRPFASTDVLGVELCGALKNIIAVAIGMAEGKEYGYNTQATLITRGLEEIMRLGVSMGAQAKTFYGLAGVGDLIATCMSPKSRNHTFGKLMGEGKTFDEAKFLTNGVAEGCASAPAALALGKEFMVPMPITAGVNKILYEGDSVTSLEDRLMSLPLYTEGLNSAKVS